MNIPLITKENFFSTFKTKDRPWEKDYLAMYSSQWQGITTDPDLMSIPVDDHLVHRGDGVFDVMRCVRGKIYQLEEHLQRLDRSAKAIALGLPPEYDRIRELIKNLVLVGGEKDCVIRLVISRGPGSFTTNPFDCPSSQLYATVIRFKPLPEKYRTAGVSLITSRIPMKTPFFATIKSCNYLPNVLMKREAVNKGCHFAVGLDEKGFLAEGSIENIGVLSADGILKFPEFETTLSGTTAKRVFQLASALVEEKVIRDVTFAWIRPEEAYQAREIFLTGTSLDILPVVSYDEKPISGGVPGPVYPRLLSLLREDMTENQDILTGLHWGDEK
ncbi:MAG: hypothetical protein GY849_15150 [Deltaproteobacteria bacterium]|nr:hypothetical protein [Deltaproteobacteria bacterium]